jgi:hypothetical protein
MPGAVIRLPFEARGLAPSISMKPVRSTSGTGNSSWLPNISSAASMCGSWSVEVAEKRLRLCSTRSKTWLKSSSPWSCTTGLPR